MTHLRTTSVAFVVAMAVAPLAFAQSLGDVARKEEARRKTVTGSGKVYTNDQLRPGDTATPPPAPAPPAANAPSPSGGQGKGTEKAPEASAEKKDEAYWRARMAEARSGLERAKAFQEALQSQINAFSTDFAARDDPKQREAIGGKRQKSLAELDRVKKEIVEYEKQIRDIEEEARRAGVPPGWLR